MVKKNKHLTRLSTQFPIMFLQFQIYNSTQHFIRMNKYDSFTEMENAGVDYLFMCYFVHSRKNNILTSEPQLWL